MPCPFVRIAAVVLENRGSAASLPRAGKSRGPAHDGAAAEEYNP